MATAAVVGLQWGDEGKGKIVTRLTPDYKYVVRFQGGSNAGHTVYLNGEKIVLHHVPSGILDPTSICMLMQGMVLYPPTFFDELAAVEKLGVDISGRVKVSSRVQITASYHRSLDSLRERAAGDAKIGTTGRGIGTTYADKANRLGLRACDLLDADELRAQLTRALPIKNSILKQLGGEAFELEPLLEELLGWGEKLKPFLCDAPMMLSDALEKGESVLFEGAQAAMLDIDMGTYPYVTSSCTMPQGIGAGCGVNVGTVDHVVGIVKAYCTRVGEGAFPTELKDATGDKIREVGGEFGSTTGRPRRCGWFDAHAVKVMSKLGRVNALAVTKLDVLADLPELKIGTGYKGWSEPGIPASHKQFAKLEAEYITLPGFTGDISGCKSFDELPENARTFILKIEELSGCRVQYVSTGPATDQLIER